jgi:hypothetical protein
MRSLPWPVVCAVAILAAIATPPSAGAPPAAWGGWSVLRLDADTGTFGSGKLELRLGTEGGARVVETDARAKILGMGVGRSRTKSVLRDDGRTERFERFSKDRGRRYVFGKDGYKVEKLKPQKSAGDEPGDWTVYFTTDHAYPTEDGRVVRPFDYYAMLVHLRQAGLDRPGDEVEMWVATTDGPQPYRVRVVEERRHQRRWVDLASGEPREEPVRELRLTVTPADPTHAEEGFLKMQGETEIWVEAESKAPVEISGKVPRVGLVRMKLEAMRAGRD